LKYLLLSGKSYANKTADFGIFRLRFVYRYMAIYNTPADSLGGRGEVFTRRDSEKGIIRIVNSRWRCSLPITHSLDNIN
jgi:hypothetical protein